MTLTITENCVTQNVVAFANKLDGVSWTKEDILNISNRQQVYVV